MNVTSSTPNLTTSEQAFTPRDIFSVPLFQSYVFFRAVFFPIIIILGVFGNVMTIVIIRRLKENSSSMDRYFLSLAATDFCVILVAPFTVWLDSATGFSVLTSHDAVCKIVIFAYNAATTSSAWILVTMATHRALMVTWPHRVNAICTPRRSSCAVIAIVVFSSVAFSHMLYGAGIVYPAGLCAFTGTYQVFLEEIWVHIELLLHSLLPIVLMLLSNSVLVRKLRVSVREASDQLATSETQTVSRAKTVNSITLQAVGVSCAFIVLTLPLSVWNLTSFIFPGDHIADLHKFVVRVVIQDICYWLGYINYSVNFYLYCLTGSRFRNQFTNICCSFSKGTA